MGKVREDLLLEIRVLEINGFWMEQSRECLGMGLVI